MAQLPRKLKQLNEFKERIDRVVIAIRVAQKKKKKSYSFKRLSENY